MADPSAILDLIDAFRRSKTMFTAVSLGIFDGARPEGEAVDRLLDGCVALGLLQKQDGGYVNTEVAETYLRRESPQTLAGYIRFSDAALYPMWGRLEDAVIEGTPRWEQVFGIDSGIFSGLFKTDEDRRDFIQGMHGMGMISSPKVAAAFDLSRFRTLADLGGATGHLALAAIGRFPEMRAILFDLPQVVEDAKRFAGDRLSYVSGDFFVDDLPPADLYALGRILHDWNEEKIRLLLKRIYAALPEGGGLLIAEKLLTDDNISGHMQSLSMLVCTEGRERTLEEYEALLREAGFREVTGKKTGAPVDALLALK